MHHNTTRVRQPVCPFQKQTRSRTINLEREIELWEVKKGYTFLAAARRVLVPKCKGREVATKSGRGSQSRVSRPCDFTKCPDARDAMLSIFNLRAMPSSLVSRSLTMCLDVVDLDGSCDAVTAMLTSPGMVHAHCRVPVEHVQVQVSPNGTDNGADNAPARGQENGVAVR